MSQIEYTDNLLKEYLVFRGLSGTLRAFELEQRSDKDNSFRAEKIVEQLNAFINNHDLQSLRDLWMHLETNLFNKLEYPYSGAVKELGAGLLKLYLVVAYKNNGKDKFWDYFSQIDSKTRQQYQLDAWPNLCFSPDPELVPGVGHYFSKQWSDTFQISLRNFLATVYQCIPQATIVRADHEALVMRRLQDENTNLKARVQTLLQQQQSPVAVSASGSTQNLHLLSSNDNLKRGRSTFKPQSLNDISPLDVTPPGHIVDDFYIIASETMSTIQYPETQARGLKMLIKNIGSNNSPVLGRKELNEKSKKRSGSVGRTFK